MKIISLNSYRQGYTGILEEADRYVFFALSKKRAIKRLIDYDKADYPTYERFAGVITKFAPASFFLKEPIYIQSMTMAELNKAYSKAKPRRQG